MSENKKVIENETIDKITDNTTNKKNEATKQEQTLSPVVVKKGSFVSFVAFIFALAALGISSYMYYLQYYKSRTNPTTHAWQQPIDVVTGKISELKQQITALQQDNQELNTQLLTLKNTTAEIQKTTNKTDTTADTITVYDDTALQTQLTELERQFNSSKQQQQQVIQEIHTQLSTKQVALDSQPKIPATTNMHTSMLAQSLLQAAYIQLNINGNPQTAQELLGKAIIQLQQLERPEYADIITQLQQVIGTIGKVAVIDSNKIDQQIQELSAASNNLTFPQLATTAQNTDTPWYEKLVVIKKVATSEQKIHSKSAQLLIKNNINAKFTLLQVALLTKNQEQWQTTIDAINLLLQQSFAPSSQTIQTQLSELQTLNLNPQYPDLQEYLQRLQAIAATLPPRASLGS